MHWFMYWQFPYCTWGNLIKICSRRFAFQFYFLPGNLLTLYESYVQFSYSVKKLQIIYCKEKRAIPEILVKTLFVILTTIKSITNLIDSCNKMYIRWPGSREIVMGIQPFGKDFHLQYHYYWLGEVSDY